MSSQAPIRFAWLSYPYTDSGLCALLGGAAQSGAATAAPYCGCSAACLPPLRVSPLHTPPCPASAWNAGPNMPNFPFTRFRILFSKEIMVASVISRYSFGSPCTVHPHMWYDDMRMFAGSRDLRDPPRPPSANSTGVRVPRQYAPPSSRHACKKLLGYPGPCKPETPR